TPFSFGDKLGPGLTALDACGHTPGHTAFLLEAKGKKLLFIGDLLHAQSLQLALPEENSCYDPEPAASTRARKRWLDWAAERKTPVAGAHMPFPACAQVRKNGAGYTRSAE
ncbi:MAG: MBL fold metallo-hydrolase, partial [Deltaproteobacteria bacterium]|nr:MBL fold metallo-hydrolase [Deltaproteobacteria bacterium]